MDRTRRRSTRYAMSGCFICRRRIPVDQLGISEEGAGHLSCLALWRRARRPDVLARILREYMEMKARLKPRRKDKR